MPIYIYVIIFVEDFFFPYKHREPLCWKMVMFFHLSSSVFFFFFPPIYVGKNDYSSEISGT